MDIETQKKYAGMKWAQFKGVEVVNSMTAQGISDLIATINGTEPFACSAEHLASGKQKFFLFTSLRNKYKPEVSKKAKEAKTARKSKVQAPAIQEDAFLDKVQAIVDQSQANLLKMMLDNGMVKKPRKAKSES